MTDDYTPTTDVIRAAYALGRDAQNMSIYRYDQNTAVAEWERIRDEANAQFDRWLAQHDEQVKYAAQAQREQSAGYEVVTDAEGERIIRPKRSQPIEVTDATDAVAVHWYDCDCEYLTKFCDENHRRSALVPRSVLRAMEDLNQ